MNIEGKGGVFRETLGVFRDTIEVIDPHGVLANISSMNAQGKYVLFCANHIISNRKRVGSLPLDFFMTKKYLKKQGISLVPVVKANHVDPNSIIGKTGNAIQKLFLGGSGWMPVYASDAAKRGEKFQTQKQSSSFNAENLGKTSGFKQNIRIMPYKSTYMHPSGEQKFDDETVDELSNTFAKETRFPDRDIVPLYLYEGKTGNYYMCVGDLISKEGKKVSDIKMEYLQGMQKLKESVLDYVSEKKNK